MLWMYRVSSCLRHHLLSRCWAANGDDHDDEKEKEEEEEGLGRS